MEDDHVFKVPTVKKKRPSLYCRESLDGLDDIWRCSKKSSPSSENSILYDSDNNTKDPVNLTINTHQKGPSPEGYRLPEIPSLVTVSGNSDDCHRERLSSHNKYAIGLLNEFNQVPTSSCQQSLCGDKTVSRNCTVGINSTSNSGKHAAKESSSLYQTVPDICSSEEEDMSMSPDVLILRDESMANADSDSSGSDVDWDSLTPPAPRSPGDHTVPDLYDLETITTPSDCLIYSYDYLASVPQAALLQRGQRGYGGSGFNARQVQQHPAASSLDHIVPDFYI